MSTIPAEARFSREDLLTAVAQLNTTDFKDFVSQILSLRAQRDAPVASASESQLLLRINRGIPYDVRRRYQELTLKRRAELLDRDESEEILGLSDQVEQLEADRVEALAELARLRRVTLTSLLSELGVSAATDD